MLVYNHESMSISDRLDGVHHLIQELENALPGAFTDNEYAYIYAALEDAREFAKGDKQ